MNQINKSTKRHPERGITLISLIITIIILVIISAIVIRTLTGDNDLIGMGAEGAENYKVAEYKEMLSIQITTTVQENMIKGEKTTLDDIASDIKENYTWAKSATVHEDEAITNSDILVTTSERICISNILQRRLLGSLHRIHWKRKRDRLSNYFYVL